MFSIIKPVHAQDLGTIETNLPDINSIIGAVVNLIFAAAGLIFFFMLIAGGFRYLSAGGDEKAAQEARKTLTNAFVGLIIVVASFLIAQLLFNLFGLSSLIQIGAQNG